VQGSFGSRDGRRPLGGGTRHRESPPLALLARPSPGRGRRPGRQPGGPPAPPTELPRGRRRPDPGAPASEGAPGQGMVGGGRIFLIPGDWVFPGSASDGTRAPPPDRHRGRTAPSRRVRVRPPSGPRRRHGRSGGRTVRRRAWSVPRTRRPGVRRLGRVVRPASARRPPPAPRVAIPGRAGPPAGGVGTAPGPPRVRQRGGTGPGRAEPGPACSGCGPAPGGERRAPGHRGPPSGLRRLTRFPRLPLTPRQSLASLFRCSP